MTTLHRRRRGLVLMPFILAALALIPLMIFGAISVAVFESTLTPIYQDRTTIVATGVQRRLEVTTAMFGDLEALRDVDPFLDEIRATDRDIDFIAITDPMGAVLYRSSERLDTAWSIERLLYNTRTDALDARLQGIADLVNRAFTRVFGVEILARLPENSRRVGGFVITRLPLRAGDVEIGAVHAGVAVDVFRQVRREVIFDAATIFFAALVIGFECTRLLFAVHIRRPRRMLAFLAGRLGQGDLRYTALVDSQSGVAVLVSRVNAFIRRSARRAARAGAGATELLLPPGGRPAVHALPASDYIRLPLFLFFLAEAILRPFLPAYLGTLPGALADASEVQVGAALAAFMMTSIIGVFAGSIAADRLSVRRVFVAGAILACLGMAAHVVARDMIEATAARALSGLGYGLVYAGAQVYIAHHAERQRKATGFSLFLAVIVTAEISGPAIGGILADRFGFDLAFGIAAGILIASLLTAVWILPAGRPDPPVDEETPAPPAPLAAGRRMAGGIRFSMLTLCFAVPAKLLLTGGLFMLIPLAVGHAGGNAVDAGRVIMVYGIAVLLSAGWIARLADRGGWFSQWVFLGGIISGIGFCVPAFSSSLTGLALAVGLFGLGQAMSIPAQITFLLKVTSRDVARYGQGAVLGAFRFFERIGSLLGPIAAAALLTVYETRDALFMLGAYALISASLGAAYFLMVGEKDEDEAINELLVET